jgi:hypothetical protein
MVKVLLILIVVAILMEDSLSVKKKSEEEKKEDEKIAEMVNITLAEEEEKRKQEENEKKTKKIDKTKTRELEEEKKIGTQEKEKTNVEQEGQDEACPACNCTCPTVKPCKKCPDLVECQPCPEIKGCDPCQECPSIRCLPCPRCEESEECPPLECPPVLPCPVDNSTSTSVSDVCPEPASMTVPVAMLVGASATVLFTGVAAAIGLILRYVPPIASGFLFLATIVLIWYLCSQYPATARELGNRAATLLREAAVALSHRIVEAIQRHQDQVGVPTKPKLFFRMSSMFF